MADDLLKELLAKPVGPAIKPREVSADDFTRKVEIKGDLAVVEVRGTPEQTSEEAAAAYLRGKGENPDLWEVTGFRAGEWTMANGTLGESARYTFKRRKTLGYVFETDISDLLAVIDSVPRFIPEEFTVVRDESVTLIVAIGDMQFGKIDGDGIEGTLRRTIRCLDKARDRLLELRSQGYVIDHVHIAWLGDHIEGFVSQGGANVWRTQLTLNEQIRLTRRVMLHALLIFSSLVGRLSMAAIPGNHGESVRFSGKGMTRYDDSHDTEALIAVADAAGLNPDRFGHVEFFVPETDELTVVVDCSGTVVAHAHGHQWTPGKQFVWWKGQAFDKGSAMHMADLLLAGHLHHEHIEADGPRTFIGVPSMESESTWFKHRTGTTGAPGLIVALTRNGVTSMKEVIHSD